MRTNKKAEGWREDSRGRVEISIYITCLSKYYDKINNPCKAAV